MFPILGFVGYIRKEVDGPDWQSPWHMHDYEELMLCTKGEGQIRIEESSFHVHEGDLIIYPKRSFHNEQSYEEKSMEFFFMGVDSLVFPPVSGEQAVLPPPRKISSVFPAGPYLPQLQFYMNELLHESSIGENMNLPTLCALASLILTSVQRAEKLSSERDEKKASYAAAAKLYIDANYKQDLSLTAIAETVFVSRHYISHIFKRDYGVSPIEYLIKKRISIAQQMLLNSSLSITEIAQEVGYKDPLYFSQIFKQHMGMSPSTFRKNRDRNEKR